MIEVESLSKHYGMVKAVDGISFQVAQGENFVLLGTSGCGKTTTLKMLNRLIEPNSGSIKINGDDIKKQPARLLRRGIGYVLQDNGLFPHYTVAQNIAIVPQLLKWDKHQTEQRTLELMHKLHLPEALLTQYPDKLSGGQQQRVGLARALMTDPPVLLMDEPFGALDPVTRFNIRREFKELDELKRKTIVMVTHDVQEAFELGDRICIMDKGKIRQIMSPADIFKPSADAFVSHFLKEQRLQLELRSVRINDLWPMLNNGLVSDSKTSLNVHNSIWEALETLTDCKETTVYTTNEQYHESKYLGFNQLMAAYYQYQNMRKQ